MRRKLRGWHQPKTKTMATMGIVLVVTRIKMNLLKRWHEISMTYKVVIIGVSLHFRLSKKMCTKQCVNEPDTLFTAQGVIEDGIFSIPRVIKLTVQLAEKKRLNRVMKRSMRRMFLSRQISLCNTPLCNRIRQTHWNMLLVTWYH